jgi:hypothetical protein
MKYEVQWSKRYYAAGTVEIEADSPEEAERITLENIGNYEGSMQYEPDTDDAFVLNPVEYVEG